MPIYDYKCRECGRVSEVLLRNTDDQAVHCPDCGSSMERLIPSSFMVKTASQVPGKTCCGRNERCETPPCSTGNVCRKG